MPSNWRNRPRPAAIAAEPGRSYNRTPGKSAEDETAAARLVVAMKRGNARGAKEPCCTDVGSQHGRQGWIDKPAQHAAGPETTTVRHGEGCAGLITRDVNGAGARSAGNPHAACDAAGTGNGTTATPTRARRGKPPIRPRSRLRVTAPVLDPTSYRAEDVDGGNASQLPTGVEARGSPSALLRANELRLGVKGAAKRRRTR